MMLGLETTLALMSSMMPVMGEKRLETVLTDSMEPNSCICVISVPISGSSQKTISPSSSVAWSVIPMMATSPSILTHSCSSV